MTNTENQPWYWEVLVSFRGETFDIVSNAFFELGASGIEELEAEGEYPQYKIFFLSDDFTSESDLDDELTSLANRTEGLIVNEITKKDYEDWQSNWKDHFRPIEIGCSFIIRPPWEASFPDKKEIVIHPGQGFGTGYHESTNLALQLLEKLYKAYSFDKAIDVGTGSGILVIACLLCGTKSVVAFDIEEEAIAEVPENLKLSGIDPALCQASVANIEEISEPANLVMANIEDFILVPMAKDLKRLVVPEGVLVLSGILFERKSDTMRHFLDEMEVIEEMTMAEWYAVSLSKRS